MILNVMTHSRTVGDLTERGFYFWIGTHRTHQRTPPTTNASHRNNTGYWFTPWLLHTWAHQ